nr:hypothetical protein [Acetobacter fallax]
MTVRLFNTVDAMDVTLELLDYKEGLGLRVDAENGLSLRPGLLGKVDLEARLEDPLAD